MNPCASPIYIYAAELSADAFCVEQVTARLKEMQISEDRVIALPDSTYLARELGQKQATVVFPGGNAMVLCEKLEKQIDKIRSAVDRGWNYLGICAGANFACQNVYYLDSRSYKMLSWEHDLHLPLAKLLEVNGRTPAFAVQVPTAQGGNNGRLVQVTAQNQTFGCYWNEGASFEAVRDHKVPVVTEAVYSDNTTKLACVSGIFGKGKVCITGVHPEIVETEAGAKNTADVDEKRKAFLKHIFQCVDIL